MTIITLPILPVAVSAIWVYTWPYGRNNSCQCEDRSVGSYIDFSSAEECLQSFSQEENEYCAHEKNGGVSLHDCESAVSTHEGVLNRDCQNLCSNLVVGVTTFEVFKESCKFEFFTSFPLDVSVVPEPSGCFSNYVFGWADYDPSSTVQKSPLNIFHDVDTPAECQSLCQLTSGCTAFNWRGAHDDLVTESSYQNPIMTCILYDAAYMNGVLSLPVNDNLLLAAGDNQFCHVDALKLECPPLASNTFNPFEDDYCLLCGCISKCAWKSKAHITGPAFCSNAKGPTDVCDYHRPIWTSSSTPAPTCLTETCATLPTPTASPPTESAQTGSKPTISALTGSGSAPSVPTGSAPAPSALTSSGLTISAGSGPTRSAQTGSELTMSTGSAPTGSGHTGSAPTGSGHTGSAPTGSGQTGSAPTGSAHTGSAPTGSGHTGSAPTGSGHTGSAPTGSGHTGSAPTGSGHTGSARTGSAHTGSAPTGSGHTGSSSGIDIGSSSSEAAGTKTTATASTSYGELTTQMTTAPAGTVCPPETTGGCEPIPDCCEDTDCCDGEDGECCDEDEEDCECDLC